MRIYRIINMSIAHIGGLVMDTPYMDRQSKPILVLGGTGKTGRRVVEGHRALGRPPRRFADYARNTAASGVWSA